MEEVAGQGEWLGGRQRERERRGDWVECTASERLKGKRKEDEERPPNRRATCAPFGGMVMRIFTLPSCTHADLFL